MTDGEIGRRIAQIMRRLTKAVGDADAAFTAYDDELAKALVGLKSTDPAPAKAMAIRSKLLRRLEAAIGKCR